MGTKIRTLIRTIAFVLLTRYENRAPCENRGLRKKTDIVNFILHANVIDNGNGP